jgi:hypothetical protein
MGDSVVRCTARGAGFVRPSLPLIQSWRRAVARAAAPFLRRFALHDLAAADKPLHARLVACIADLDNACASERPELLAAAGAALVEVWKEVVAVMAARHGADEAPRQATHRDWLIQLAKLSRWPGTSAQSPAELAAQAPAFEFAERPLGVLMTSRATN